MKKIKKHLNINLIIAAGMALILFSGMFFAKEDRWFWYDIVYLAVIVGSVPFVINIISSLRRGIFGVDIIAITAIVATLATNEIIAAAIVVFMLSGGESLEKYAENKARSSLEKLLHRAPTKASVYVEGELKVISIKHVKIGDIIAIKKGEIIPVDGTVHEGISVIDESVITGEPIPRDVFVGDGVVSGTTNEGDFFTMKAIATYEKSVFSGIVRLVEKAEKEKAPTVRLADRYSVYFTVLTFSMAGIAFIKDPHLATAVLVVATPCPLILAAPIAFIAGMSRSAKRGIIVKHGGVFEAILKAKAFFFDKTGTLTLGIPQVSSVNTFLSSVKQDNVLRYAASLDQASTHVLAQGIVTKATSHDLDLITPTSVKEITGEGVTGVLEGKEYSIGKLSFLESLGVEITDEEKEKNNLKIKPTVYISEGKVLIGSIVFSDLVRKEVKEVLKELLYLRNNIELVLITGDSEKRAEEVGKSLGFTKIKANSLPKDKSDFVKEYEKNGKLVAMIGDGVNDAPSLASASVGIALGSHGATASTDIADAVIMVDDLERLVSLVDISKKTVRVAKQSMFIGMGLSVTAMFFAMFGYLPPIEGAILQEGIDVLVILNALRALI